MGFASLVTIESLDAIEQSAAEQLIVARLPPGRVVHTLAKAFPDAPALNFTYALCCVAATIEAQRNGKTLRLPDAAEIYRVAAVLAADVFGLETSTGRFVNGTDLLFHWVKTADPLFR